VNVCGCDGRVPTVSPRQAGRIASWLGGEVRRVVEDGCIAWLTEEHPELAIKSGYTAERAYDPLERVAVAAELYAVERTACPFQRPDGTCVLGLALVEVRRHPTLRGPPYGWLPTLLLKALRPTALRELAHSRWIADAKLAVLQVPGNFPEPRWSTNQPYVSRPSQLVTVSQPKKEVTDDGSLPQDLQSRPD
jgi:hypothetical protein